MASSKKKPAAAKSAESKLVKLATEIAEKAIQHRQHFKLKGKPTFHPGADEKAIERLKKRWRHPMPVDYLDLLRAHDGIDYFDAPAMMLASTGHLLANTELDDVFVDAGMFKAGEIFIFCYANSDAHSVAFRAKKGKVTVIDFDA